MSKKWNPTPLMSRALPVVGGALALGLMMTVPSSATSVQSTATPLPGYWEYSTRVLGVGETETKCVRQSEINRFFGGLSTRRWSCTYPVKEVGNGQARFEGTCRDHKDRTVRVRLSGPYDAESFRFSGGAQLARGTPYIPASITARRISGTCPAGAEYF
jgi:hypothetical protein